MKQVQIDGLVSGVPFPQAHVGSSVLSSVPPEALLGSLPLGRVRLGQGFLLKSLSSSLFAGRRSSFLYHLLVVGGG